MNLMEKVRQRKFDRLIPAMITGVLLCGVNYVMDIALDWFGMPASKTVLNDMVIGFLGAVAVYYYLSASQENYNFARARERITLIGELNLRIRESMVAVLRSAMSEDISARLQGIDEAMDGIDEILCDFRREPKVGDELRGR
jgi:hypothetical protein